MEKERERNESVFGLEMVDRIVSMLKGLTNENLMNTLMGMGKWMEQSVFISEVVNDAVLRSNLRVLNGIVHVFNGEIYVPVSKIVMRRAIETYLKAMHVNTKILIFRSSYIFNDAYDTIMLKEPLQPSFAVHAFTNGVVDLSEGVLHPFDEKYHVVFKHEYPFDPNAKCPMWDGFLKEVLEEKESRLMLQMYFGLCCFDRSYMKSKVEACLIMYGSGSNGKSTIQDVIAGVLGECNVSHVPLKSMVVNGDEKLRAMCRIDGKLVNMGPELSKKEITGHEDEFKKLCSGETQLARRIGGNVYEFENVPWMVFSMNNMLKMDDISHGLKRRILYCVFDKIIPNGKQNRHLANDLQREYSGIMNWLIRGSKKLIRSRFQFPCSKKSVAFSRLTDGFNDSLGTWVQLRDIRFFGMDKEERPLDIQANDLYDDYQRFCEINGLACDVAFGGFGKAITKFSDGAVVRKRMRDGVHYYIYGVTEVMMKDEPPIIREKVTLEDWETYEDAMYNDL